MFILYLVIGFVFTPIDSTHVYLSQNGYASLRFELYNNGYFNATFNLIVKRNAAPQDLEFQMCFHNQCFFGDSQSITVEAGSRDTIALDFIAGNETGGIDIYYLTYDQASPASRDSIEITGGVGITEQKPQYKEKKVFFDGRFIKGYHIKYAVFYNVNGRQIMSKPARENRISTDGLKPGIYFVKVKTNYGVVNIKIMKEEP